LSTRTCVPFTLAARLTGTNPTGLEVGIVSAALI
jgi:hypothetical protein